MGRFPKILFWRASKSGYAFPRPKSGTIRPSTSFRLRRIRVSPRRSGASTLRENCWRTSRTVTLFMLHILGVTAARSQWGEGRCQVSGLRCQVPGVGYRASGVGCQKVLAPALGETVCRQKPAVARDVGGVCGRTGVPEAAEPRLSSDYLPKAGSIFASAE